MPANRTNKPECERNWRKRNEFLEIELRILVGCPRSTTLKDPSVSARTENRKFYEQFTTAQGFVFSRKLLSEFHDYLRTIIENSCCPRKPAGGKPVLRPGVQPRTYIVFSEADRQIVESCEDFFVSRDWEPRFTPRSATRKLSTRPTPVILKTCQAYVIYYGQMARNVIDVFDNDFADAQPEKRTLPFYSKWIFRAPEPTPEKAKLTRKVSYRIAGDMSRRDLPDTFVDGVTSPV